MGRKLLIAAGCVALSSRRHWPTARRPAITADDNRWRALGRRTPVTVTAGRDGRVRLSDRHELAHARLGRATAKPTVHAGIATRLPDGLARGRARARSPTPGTYTFVCNVHDGDDRHDRGRPRRRRRRDADAATATPATPAAEPDARAARAGRRRRRPSSAADRAEGHAGVAASAARACAARSRSPRAGSRLEVTVTRRRARVGRVVRTLDGRGQRRVLRRRSNAKGPQDAARRKRLELTVAVALTPPGASKLDTSSRR